MANEDESIKAEDSAKEGSIQQKNHRFATHSSGTWDQNELISSAEKGSKADLPPRKNKT